MNQQELKQAVLTEKSRQGVLILAHTYQIGRAHV